MKTLLARNHGVDIGERFNPPGFLKDTTGVGDLVSIILANALTLAGVLLLILLVGGGIGMIAGAGGDNPERVAQGKKAVTAALLGFLLILASFAIIQVIELITGLNIL